MPFIKDPAQNPLWKGTIGGIRSALRGMQQPSDDNVTKAQILGGLGGALEGALDTFMPDSGQVGEALDPGTLMGNPAAVAGSIAAKPIRQIAGEAYGAVKGLPGLYSRLTDAMVSQLPKVAKPSRIASIASSGASQEEAAIRGLNKFLEGRDPNVGIPREEVLSHLESNPLKVMTKTREYPATNPDAAIKFSKYSPGEHTNNELMNYKERQLLDPRAADLEILKQDLKEASNAYTNAQLPIDPLQDELGTILIGTQASIDHIDEIDNALLKYNEAFKKVEDLKNSLYGGGHWKNPGTFVHTRSNVFPSAGDPDERMHTVFEAQSDLHQSAGRRFRDFMVRKLAYPTPSAIAYDPKVYNQLQKAPLGELKRKLAAAAEESPAFALASQHQGYRPSAAEILNTNTAINKRIKDIEKDHIMMRGNYPESGDNSALDTLRNASEDMYDIETWTKRGPFSENVSYDMALKNEILAAVDNPETTFFGLAGPETVKNMFPSEANVEGMEHFYGKEYPDRLKKIMRPFFEATGLGMEKRNLPAFEFRPDDHTNYFIDDAGQMVLGRDPVDHPSEAANNVAIASLWPKTQSPDELYRASRKATLAGNMAESDRLADLAEQVEVDRGDGASYILGKIRDSFYDNQMRPAGQEVTGFQMTPEIRDLIKKIGFPAMMALLGLRAANSHGQEN